MVTPYLQESYKVFFERIILFSITEGIRELILEAMKELSAQTCIKFKERTNEEQWVKFVQKSG